MAVPALNFDLVGDKGGRVPHDEGVSVDQVLRPDFVHPRFPVTHLVLKAWTVVFNGRQRLQHERDDMKDCFYKEKVHNMERFEMLY